MMSVQCRPRGFGMASHGKGPGSGRTLSFLLADICHGHVALFPYCYLGEAFSFLMVPRGGRMAQANVSVHLPLLLGNVRAISLRTVFWSWGPFGEESLGVLDDGFVYF